MNRCLGPDDGRLAHGRLAAAAERLLGVALRFLGAVPEDPALRTVMGALGPGRLLDAIQSTAAARTIMSIAMEQLAPPRPMAPATLSPGIP